jgi:CheY-like chemotaxis protein
VSDGGGGRRTDFRVRLLGPFERFTPDGRLIEPQPNNRPRPEDARLLATLVLHRVGHPVPEDDLLRAGWDNDTGGRDDLQPALSRLRGSVSVYGKDGQLPIAMTRVNRTYTLDLPREAVDATYFIDQVNAGLPDHEPGLLGALCGLWRGDPFKVHGNVPDHIWAPLLRALKEFQAHLRTMQTTLSPRIGDWERFWSLWDDAPPPQPRILVVDDDRSFVESLERILTGYECDCAYTVDQALRKITAYDQRPFEAALVDLHLTPDGADALGVTVLEEMLRSTPEVPRLLLTRNPPEQSQIEAVRKYGLVDVYKKRETASAGGPSPQLRSVVDGMLKDRAVSLRTDAEREITRLDKRIGRALAGARRQGLVARVEALTELHQRWSEEAEEFEARIESSAVTRQHLDEFLRRWRVEVERKVDLVT